MHANASPSRTNVSWSYVAPVGVGTLVISRGPIGATVVAVAAKVAVSVPLVTTTARTDCAPTVAPRVKTVDACPLASVVDVAGRTVPPPLTTVHVTWISDAGTPDAPVTTTVSGVTNVALALAVWPLPLNTAMAYGPVVPDVMVVGELHAAPASMAAASAT